MKKLITIVLLALGAIQSPFALADGPAIPDEYKDLRWHRKETANFEILAIDSRHAQQIKSYVETLKTWTCNRWGLSDVPFQKPCMIICVPSQELFKEFTRKDDVEPKASMSKNPDGTDRPVFTIWIAATPDDSWLTATLPEKLSRICLLNYEATYGIKLGTWAHVGMSALNNNVGTVRNMLTNLNVNQDYESGVILSTTEADYIALTPEDKQVFRREAAALCLMLRKEFGHKRFHSFLAKSTDASPPVFVFGFSDIDQFNVSYNSFVRNLGHDLQTGRTPDSYLTWFLPKKAQASE